MLDYKIVNVIIDGKRIAVPADYTVLKACESIGISIPRLCFLEGIHEEANCRMCVVKIKGMNGLKSSCRLQVWDGMEIETNTPEVISAVKQNLELLAANHRFECWSCAREHSCEFLHFLKRYNIKNIYSKDKAFVKKEIRYMDENPAMILDATKCILCGRCVSTCRNQVGLNVLDFNERGSKTYVGPANFHGLEDAGCIYCGKCLQSCPTSAITEKDDIQQVMDALNNPNKTVVVQVAPAVRAALGEEFKYPMGTNVEGRMYAALKLLGFKEFMDTNFAADLTIMEEGTELIQRLNGNGPLPMMTSCSPGWIRYIERYAPEYLPNLSTCKSPMQMGGALIKSYYSKKLGVDPKDIVSVAIMPCIAKKYEASRPEMEVDGIRDVDYVLTTRELARMIRDAEIDFSHLRNERQFGELAQYTGAGAIFGTTGGVMEAALRTVSEILEDKPTQVDFTEVRGVKDIKEATYTIQGKEINVAVVHGAKAIKEFLNILKEGKKQYHFIEFMGCTGGCVNGGGQPIVRAKYFSLDLRSQRASALYKIDAEQPLRKSHLNRELMRIYKEFIGEPCGEKAHKLFHTHYSPKGIYTKEH